MPPVFCNWYFPHERNDMPTAYPDPDPEARLHVPQPPVPASVAPGAADWPADAQPPKDTKPWEWATRLTTGGDPSRYVSSNAWVVTPIVIEIEPDHWINPEQVVDVVAVGPRENRTQITMANGSFFFVDFPARTVAAMLNGGSA